MLQFYKHLQQLKCDTTLHEVCETSVQITHLMGKCWNESLYNIIKYSVDDTNIGADA